jgi:DNA-binding transcriptional regulator LsrR (DeoR family)
VLVARIDELRLLAKVARMYYEADLRQPEIAERLSLSQATISRLLKRAEREGIVRISVSVPSGAFTEQEEALETRYDLKEAIVVDSLEDSEQQVMRDLGAAAAYYVETTLRPNEVVGIASYASILPMVNALHPRATPPGVRVVQLSGGVGNPAAEAHGTQMVRRLASLLSAQAIYLPAPGLAASPEAKAMFLQDPFVGEALRTFDEVTLALVGMGIIERAGLTGFMGSFKKEERDALLNLGAVGFICQRFYDAKGQMLATPIDERIVAMSRAQLAKVERVVGISGGPHRTASIRGALEGRWVNVLITDRFTAARLLDPSA